VAAASLPFILAFPARTTLTKRDRVVLRAVAEAMFSPDGEIERARIDAHLDELDSYISAASKPVRAGLRLALFVVRVAPVLLFFRLTTIERLPVDDRVAVLLRLERSAVVSLSLAFTGWRAVMTLVFYEHPDELLRLGYDGDERKIYKRRLAMAEVVVASVPAVPVPPDSAPVPSGAPPSQDSGVRLRRRDLDDHEAADADDSGEHRVA
jgi:hypothetical protein